MAIENNIKMYRAKYNLTQSELAKKVQVTRQTIISLEKDSYVPSLELAMNLSETFNVSVETIFYKQEEKE
ncbi:helix-turn-helix transcriptional regulator [Jeotgalibaca dankookensis]|uniref:helix-turn-helix transcriptional regulator n=1 Tax=Jeotgalibaca dankookensis TaxID=708126 RepID=UPI0012E2474D|nr:helix-turn-helix transcriptional regulator [Jeotgalibaca dankookensis]